jgi:hypothetical protein
MAGASVPVQETKIVMTISMYEASVPVFIRAFGNLAAILRKGAEHGGDGLVEARLAPDMYALTGQVQRASDTAKGCAARLGGIDAPSFPDNEKTFADLQDRIGKTVGFLQGVKAGQIDGSEQKPIEFKAGTTTLHFVGSSYLLTFALPNFFFHVATAYAILRNQGVAVGKMDYLGSMPKV